MKCHKCSYVSFDHLSACKKCGVGLEDARSALGFTSQSSAVPFLLGILLSDEKGGKQSQPVSLQSANELSDEFSTLDMGEGFELFGDDEGQEASGANDNVPVRAEVRDEKVRDDQRGSISDVAAEPSIFLDDSDDFSLSLSFEDMGGDGPLEEASVLPEGAKTSSKPINAGNKKAEENLFEKFEISDAFSEEMIDFDFSEDSSLESGQETSSPAKPGRSGDKRSRGLDNASSYVSKPSRTAAVIKSGKASEELDLPELTFDDLELEDLSLESDISEGTVPAHDLKNK